MNNKMLVLMIACMLSSNALFAQDKPEAAQEKQPEKTEVASVSESESPANKKMVVELQKLIESRESVKQVYIQLDLPEPIIKDTPKAVVLLQPAEDKISDEEISKIKSIISTTVDGLDVKDINLVKMDLGRLRRDMGMMGMGRPFWGKGKQGERPEMGGRRGGLRGGMMRPSRPGMHGKGSTAAADEKPATENTKE